MHDSSGRQLDHWDLHVGAELDMSGKKIVLKKVRFNCHAVHACCQTFSATLEPAQHLMVSVERQLSQLAQ